MRFLIAITLALVAALLFTTATAAPVAPVQQCTFTADFQSSGEGSASVTYAGTLTMHADPDNAGVYFIDTLTGTRTEGAGSPQTIVALDHNDYTPRFAGSSTQGAFIEVALSLSGGDSSTIECGLGDCVDTHGSTMLSNGHIVTSCQAKIIGDPAFVGFLGQRFQVHGTPNVVHNVISAPVLLVNALFVFLDRGDCPVYNGKVMRGNCFAHPGTYFGELGFRTRSNDRVHIIAGSAKSGFDALMINGKAIAVGESVDASSSNDASSSLLSVTRTSTHTATVRTALFEFDIENSDMYINLLNVRINDLRTVRSQDVHGLLGQTWRSRRGSIDGVKLKEIDGTVDDYVELDNDLFGQNVLFSRFHAEDEQDDAKQQQGDAKLEARSARVLPPNMRDVVVDDKMNGKATLIALRNRIRGQ